MRRPMRAPIKAAKTNTPTNVGVAYSCVPNMMLGQYGSDGICARCYWKILRPSYGMEPSKGRPVKRLGNPVLTAVGRQIATAWLGAAMRRCFKQARYGRINCDLNNGRVSRAPQLVLPKMSPTRPRNDAARSKTNRLDQPHHTPNLPQYSQHPTTARGWVGGTT